MLGSIPTGYLVAKVKGVDIRTVGSGNIGATNVFRILGKQAGVFVLTVDALKGVFAVLLARNFIGGTESHALLAAFCAILGHNYPCWLRFKGGKGVATTAGVLFALTPAGLGIALGVWLIVFSLSRYVSLASIAAAISLPFAAWFGGGGRATITLLAFLGALAIYKHKVNIQKLMNGTENRFSRPAGGQKGGGK